MHACRYVSTIDALNWLLKHKLLVPTSIVRYDDWPHQRVASASASIAGMNETRPVGAPPKLWGQSLAHEEMTQKYGLVWEHLGRDAFQLKSVGSATPDSGTAHMSEDTARMSARDGATTGSAGGGGGGGGGGNAGGQGSATRWRPGGRDQTALSLAKAWVHAAKSWASGGDVSEEHAAKLVEGTKQVARRSTALAAALDKVGWAWKA